MILLTPSENIFDAWVQLFLISWYFPYFIIGNVDKY